MDYKLEEEIVERFFEKIKSFIIPSENNNYKSRFLQSNILLYCVVLLLVLKIGATLISINIPQNIFFADITKSALENFVNQTRQSLGLGILSNNLKLDQAAQLKAENMAQNNYFDHTSPSGVSPWFWFVQAGYKYKYAGENLAIGFYESEEVYNAWLNSPSHRENITNPNYTEVGTAVLKGFGQNNSIVVVQEFGSQSPVKQAAPKSNNIKPVAAKTGTNTTVKTTGPASTTAVQTPVTNVKEQVLSQETISQNYLESARGNSANNFLSKVLNSVLYNYDKILQDIIYGVSSVVIGILLALIFFNINFNFKRELVFRAVLIIVLLSVATLTNKEVIISLIPHQIII
jgi:uncharacterized protein YkwD